LFSREMMHVPPLLVRLALTLSLVLPTALSCGPAAYLANIREANEVFEQAKAEGAEEQCPYEFYGAEVRLAEARRYAGVAEYGAARKLARESIALSRAALEEMAAKKSKAKHATKEEPLP